ncbi:voltage-gated potassium channel [Anaeromyces robustus]|uniref:Voltage-gated potassium channel n=1 Tax=Anaeromyces robustus TaxID=1754192 RepID=A0A1Y1WT06_9FUNG|nr:voltage-gated potassium channel [Anaeromyces robustus]|eukprot:ORX76376.1 voltage-gated potassium channel [Anaeromyces robustus]
MKSIKKESRDITKQTINVLTVLLYNSRLCSRSSVLNLINFLNFFVTTIAVYIHFVSSIPNFREEHNRKYVITEYLITTYYIIEILIRYFLYTFYDITTYGRMNEIYNEKSSLLNLNERQYRIITIDEVKDKDKIKSQKKKKNFIHLIRFFYSKIEIICLLNVLPLFVQMIINKSRNEIYNDSKFSLIYSALQYTRFIRFAYYIINTRLSNFFKIDMLIQVFKNSKEGIISTVLLSLWTILFVSGFFFFAETYDCEYNEDMNKLIRHNSNNEIEECRVQTILDAFWWALVTVQCIGYGDLTPATPLGKIINGIMVLISNMIFMIPSAILTIEFLELIMEKKKKDIIDKAVVKCELKIDKARRKKFNKELLNILSNENIQNNANTFLKYYSINGSMFGSTGSLRSNHINDSPTNIIDFFKLKKNNNSLNNVHGSNHSLLGSNESLKPVKKISPLGLPRPNKSTSLDEKRYADNSLNEYIKSTSFSSINNNNQNIILKTNEIPLNDPTVTIKYGLGDKLLDFSKKNCDPDLLKLNKIIKNQRYLNKITVKSSTGYSKPFGMEGNNSADSYSSTESSCTRNRKNEKGEIEVELKLGEVKYMSASEISKELYKLSMEYYASCEDEFTDVDEQSGILYLLMKGFEKTIQVIRKMKENK